MPIQRFRSLFAIFFILITTWSCTRTQADTPVTATIRPVKVMVIQSESATRTRQYPGVVAPATETRLAFRVGGPLIRFDVKIGQRVHKGDLIAQIDPRDYQIQVRRLMASFAEARAALKAMKTGARPEDIASLTAEHGAALSRLNEARLNFERYERLYKAHAAAKATFDNAQAAFDTAKAAAEAAEKALEKARKGARVEDIEAMEARITGISVALADARNRLADTRLTAPFDGVIHQKFVENFETVADGTPIVSFFDTNRPEVTIRVPESVIAHPERITRVTSTLDLFPQTVLSGEIKEIGTRAEAANQSYPLTVSLTALEPMDIHPGMAATVQVSIATDANTSGLFLPLAALANHTGDTSKVFILDPETQTVHPVPVATGQVREDRIEILKGLSEGDEVVSAGARFLRPGQKVRRLMVKKGDRAA